MIREDRELLAELAWLNTDMASLGMRIVEGIANGTEQRHYAQRLIAAGKKLRRRADEMDHPVIEGEVLADAEPVTDMAEHIHDRAPRTPCS